MNVLGWLLIVAALVAFVVPFVREGMRPGPVRKGAPGKVARLSTGETHYRWIGPVRGPVAVLIHGIATPAVVWDGIAEGLAQTAFRVLVYDLPGRGLSDAAGGRHDADFYVRHLEELLAHEGLTEDLTLVGYSMGGAIATAFAARNPDRMTRLVLVAPAGVVRVEAPLDAVMRRVPVLGDWLHAVVAPVHAARHLGEPGPVADARAAQARRRGHFPTLLASRRGILSQTQEAEHRAIGKADVPVLAIWGSDDRAIPLRGLGTLAQWNRNARQEVVEGADHALPMTHPEAVVAAMRTTLRED